MASSASEFWDLLWEAVVGVLVDSAAGTMTAQWIKYLVLQGRVPSEGAEDWERAADGTRYIFRNNNEASLTELCRRSM